MSSHLMFDVDDGKLYLYDKSQPNYRENESERVGDATKARILLIM